MIDKTFHRYARGFQLTEEDVPSPHPGWLSQKALRLTLHHDPRTKLAVAEAGRLGVLIIGEVIDVSDPEAGFKTIANTALRALRVNEKALLAYANTLGGRHLIVYRTKELHVLGDATCSLSCFYSAKPPLVAASHARIVADVRGAGPNGLLESLSRHPAWQKSRPARSYPGDQTPFEDVFLLTANVVLDASDMSIRRFWPTRPREEYESSKVANECIDLMQPQIVWLTQQSRRLVMSATAGLDSRTAVAIARSAAADITFFTHKSEKAADRQDAETFSIIAAQMGLHHVLIDTRDHSNLLPDETFQHNSFFPHSRSATATYLRLFPESIHIRSNLAEIGRAYYRGLNVTYPETATPRALARSWRHMQSNPAAVAAFEQWITKTGLVDVGMSYDYLDLFYWEHRMPAWYGLLLRETDIALETLSIFNTRNLLQTMLGAPEPDRVAGAVQRQIIHTMWPELTQFPINGGPFWK